MKLSLVKKSEAASTHFTTIMNAIHSCSESCGLILTMCDLENKQLRALKKFLVKESGTLQTRLLYDVSSKMITILLEGMASSTTHWFGLAVKSYMKNNFSFEKGVLVASFSQDQYPQAREIGEMVKQLMVDANAGDSLTVFKARSLQEEKERTVLIIDDDKVAGKFLKVQLESQGYQVHQAYDGVQGINSCEELSPDIVIMELNLPALDGYQVIRNIQSNDALESQIIVLSEQRLEKDITACLNLGVTEYITKPYSPDELEQILNKVLDEIIEEVI
jgi:two-component system, OmpR family, response regulator